MKVLFIFLLLLITGCNLQENDHIILNKNQDTVINNQKLMNDNLIIIIANQKTIQDNMVKICERVRE